MIVDLQRGKRKRLPGEAPKQYCKGALAEYMMSQPAPFTTTDWNRCPVSSAYAKCSKEAIGVSFPFCLQGYPPARPSLGTI